jgi:hypothetical protein
VEQRLARDAARRERRAAKQRRRREQLAEEQKILTWVERGYGRRRDSVPVTPCSPTPAWGSPPEPREGGENGGVLRLGNDATDQRTGRSTTFDRPGGATRAAEGDDAIDRRRHFALGVQGVIVTK